MPRRHRLTGLRSKHSGGRRKRRYEGPPLPYPPVLGGTVEDMYEPRSVDYAYTPRCPAAPEACKCAAEIRRTS
jgi:hypothetical protein